MDHYKYLDKEVILTAESLLEQTAALSFKLGRQLEKLMADSHPNTEYGALQGAIIRESIRLLKDAHASIKQLIDGDS